MKPSASRAESNELYLLANGYEQSQHESAKKSKLIQKEIQSMRTVEDFEKFEENISKEGKELAENILKDLRR